MGSRKLEGAGIAFPLPLGIGFNTNLQQLKSRVTDLHLGQAGVTRVPAGFFAGQTVTVQRASETRREKKRARKRE